MGDRWAWCWPLVLFAAACGEQARSSAADQLEATAETSQEAEANELSLPRDTPPEQVLPLAQKRYAQGYVAEGPMITGELARGGSSDHLLVLKTGVCYRVVGVGGEGVSDLDLLLYDPAGVQSNQDSGQDRFPVLGMQSELCPPRGGAYRLQVQMYEGAGRFAVGLSRSQ